MKAKQDMFVKGNLEKIWFEIIQPALRENLISEKILDTRMGKKWFNTGKYLFKLTQIPAIRERLPQFSPDKSNISWIPINREIEGAGQIALPEEILGRFIEKAKHRVIVNFCSCRVVHKCKDYPADIGCLMMGESALNIPGKASREVGVEEAKAHVRKAVEAGLVPITGKARIDNDLFMIPDEGKLLTVCLCCECCCITRFARYASPQAINGILHPVEGLSVEVTEECIGCGECVSKCYANAIKLYGTRAVINELCGTCGRCAMHCPQKAIKLTLENPNAVDDVVRRIESVVDF